MANTQAKKFSAPKTMNVDGRAVFYTDKATVAAAATNDTVDFVLPAGLDLMQMAFVFDDLDSNGAPTAAFKAGYTPVDASSSLAPNLTYFAAAGQTTAQAGGRYQCAFKPIKFEEDVIVRLTWTTGAATFQAGDVVMVAAGNGVGVK